MKKAILEFAGQVSYSIAKGFFDAYFEFISKPNKTLEEIPSEEQLAAHGAFRDRLDRMRTEAARDHG